MSTLIAVSDGVTIEAGADTAGTSTDNDIYRLLEEKIFIRGPYLFGCCHSLRVGQILRYEMELPEPPPADHPDLTEFVVRELVPRIRSAVTVGGAAHAGIAPLGERTVILFGYRARIWCICPDMTVFENTPRAAIGSGRRHALGALHALDAAGVRPLRRLVELALGAASEFTTSVRPPFHFVRLAES